MFEKVNPMHPDKIADRIAGAVVDLAYAAQKDPKIAVEVLIGHGVCHIIAESSVRLSRYDVEEIVERITQSDLIEVDFVQVPQDTHLAGNQQNGFRCGDNGIFKGVPTTLEQRYLSAIAHTIYDAHGTDGKYILDGDKLIVCQSNLMPDFDIRGDIKDVIVNPLGDWTGGPDVDSGATNRKLGSDMADSVTGGGLHGKDLSKADVSVNIYAWLKAQETGEIVSLSCAIGDDTIDGKPYSEIVEIARQHVNACGGFEKFAEWGLV